MNTLLKNFRLTLIILHVFIGVAISFLPLSKIFGISIILFGMYWIIANKNKNEEALIMSAYLVGAEVFLRMTSGVFLYETGKYGVILFLTIGALVGKNKLIPNPLFLIYLLLILIGIAFTRVPEGESLRKAVAFNLSGPFILGLSALYFYFREVSLKQLYSALFSMLLPIISMVIYLYFRTPSLSEIQFGGVANYETSGGFGPNQVATVLGLGVFVILFFNITKQKVSGYLLLDFIILFYILYRGLLTFSRGGIITAFLALIIFFFFYILYTNEGLKIFLKYSGVAIILFVGVWFFTSSATGGMLENRYTGKNARGIQKKDISSGRNDLLYEQFNSFYESPIVGIGVGNGKFKRNESDKDITAASHNEVGRLLEEHGLIGVFSLVLLLFSPLTNFISANYFQKGIIAAFFILWLLTIGHSAMRIAFPGFIYGLSLINLIEDD